MTRPQQHRLKWPLTPSQVEGIDEMFETLFRGVKATAATADQALSHALSTGVTGRPGVDGRDYDDDSSFAGYPVPGPAGVIGSTGSIGIQGLDGEDGEQGPPGVGIVGAAGATGAVGPVGRDGEDGEDTNWWPSGVLSGDLPQLTGSVYIYGLWTDFNIFTVQRDTIGTATTDGFVAQNTTLATAGVPVQWSPRLKLRGNVWDTGTVANKTVDWIFETQGTSGNPIIGTLNFGVSFAGGTVTNLLSISASATNAGTAKFVQIQHNDNTSGTSQAQLKATVGGSAGGDPSVVLGISGAYNWSVGCDNSDSDSFKIGGNIAVGTSTAVTIDSVTFNVGFGGISPTAQVHIKAGTATANTAPLKFNSGTLLTTAEAGAVEFLTDAYYGTITTGAARKTFAFLESPSFTTPAIGVATGTSLSLSNTVNLISTGGAATAGQLTLGVGGTLTVNTTAMTATALLFCQRKTAGGTIGFATTYTQVNGTSFTLSSDSALDTSVYNWWIVETH